MSGGTPHHPGRCRDLLAELFDYLDGDLSPARCAAIERHLSQCPCCGDMADNLRKAIAICRAEGRRALPVAVRARARRRVAALMQEGPGGRGPRKAGPTRA
jgi:anti-sigma factor RsiW